MSALAAALVLTGCGAVPEQPDPSRSQSVQQSPIQGPDCLMLVWQNQDAPNEAFDRARDNAPGGAISCATGTSASQFEAALAAIRGAARSGDRRRLLDQLGMPLLYIDGTGKRREVRREDLANSLFDEVFDPVTIDLLSRVRLEDLTVVSGQGAFVELGAVWLVVDHKGGRPRIATVNRQALDEALEAAHRAVKEGDTTPAPLRDR